MNFSKLVAAMNSYEVQNRLMDEYYEGEFIAPKYNISLPPSLQNAIETVVGWPATTIDVLHERTDWLGWDAAPKWGLQEVYEENQLEHESSLCSIDSLMYGISYAAASKGRKAEGEPDVLVTIESPKNMTGIYNRRKRRLDIAAQRVFEQGEFLAGVLYEENQTVYYRRATVGSPWKVEWIDKHNMGRVQVVQFVNRARAGRMGGKSEITRAVRSYTNMAVRTLLGMEINREFFSTPARYVLGAKPESFQDGDGNPIPGWKAIMGALWNLERDEEWVETHGGEGLPQVGEFKPNPPGPYIDQIKGLAEMFSAEVGIPASYLGFSTQNPPSADAIRALEARLIKRAERRITGWNASWVELGQMAAFLKTREFPSKGDLPTRWRDPSTPTAAADADRAVKLVGAQILPSTSSVTYDMVGLNPSQQKRLERDVAKQAFQDMLRGGGPGAGNGESGTPSGNPGSDRNANSNGNGQAVAGGNEN